MHPSYEDRAAVCPTGCFAAVSARSSATTWSRRSGGARCERAFGAEPDVLHLHHLTPLHEAAARALPGRAAGDPPARHRAEDDRPRAARAGRTAGWEHAASLGRARCARWAQRSRRLIVISPHDREEAERLLGVDPELVTWVPNGVDLERFDRSEPSLDERLARWREWLVEEPLGWGEGGEPGSVAYTTEDLDRASRTRTPASRRRCCCSWGASPRSSGSRCSCAPTRARGSASTCRAPLVIWGGFPGEWEGEHPHTVALEEGVEDVFFVGWRGHGELDEGLACSRRDGHAVDQRVVRAGVRRGDGLRRAGDRRQRGRTALVRERRGRAGPTAGWSSPTTSTPWRTRWSRR